MRGFVLAALLFAAPAMGAQPLLQLSSNQSSYAVGATAQLHAIALVVPCQSDDFYLGATLNGAPIAVNQESDGVGYTQTAPLTAGSYTWTVQLYLEDHVLAGQLNNAIQALNLQNAQITTELAQTTDPTQIASLQAQEAENTNVINEANNELINIRTPFGASQSLTFTAQ